MMRGALTGSIALLSALPTVAQDKMAAAPGHGIWRGTVGTAPVMMCLDGDGAYKRGSYYYTRRLIPIRLDWDDKRRRWNGVSVQDKVQATFQFDKVAKARIDGRWIGGGNSLSVTLNRLPSAEAPHDFGLCGSMTYLKPRLGPTRVTQVPAVTNGVKYRKLKLVVPDSFAEVSIESFALLGRSPAVARINRELAKPLSAAGIADGWIDCMRGNLSAHGVDGDYATSIEPTMFGRRYLSVDHHNGGYCGGAHPYSGTDARTFDLSTGLEIDLNDWLTPRAIRRERYAGTSDEAKMVTPAFRAFLLAGWKHPDRAECQEIFEQAEFWDIALTRTGLGFTPSLPHVAQACGEEVVVPWTRLQPYLNPTGQKAVAAIGAEMRR